MVGWGRGVPARGRAEASEVAAPRTAAVAAAGLPRPAAPSTVVRAAALTPLAHPPQAPSAALRAASRLAAAARACWAGPRPAATHAPAGGCPWAWPWTRPRPQRPRPRTSRAAREVGSVLARPRTRLAAVAAPVRQPPTGLLHAHRRPVPLPRQATDWSYATRAAARAWPPT